MAKQQRMSRKEVLSQPDPSEIFAMRVSIALDWAKENLRYILYGVMGVVAVVIVIIAWSSWQGHRHEQASVLLHQALKLVDEDSETKDPDQAIEKLQDITKTYGRTPAGARAFWHLGHLYFERGEMAEALKAYQVARRRMPNRQPLSSTLAILNMGYAQEATDACGEAITSYESVQQSTIRWLHGEAYLGMGRCHEKAGDTKKAIEVYDRALADVNVTGTTQQTISERLARLQPAETKTPAADPTAAKPSEAPANVEEKSPEAAESGAAEEKPSAPVESTAASQADESTEAKPSSVVTGTISQEATPAASETAPSEGMQPSETEDAKPPAR